MIWKGIKWLEAVAAAVLSVEQAVVVMEQAAGRGLWGEMHSLSTASYSVAHMMKG